jgi:hypothetical protein
VQLAPELFPRGASPSDPRMYVSTSGQCTFVGRYSRLGEDGMAGKRSGCGKDCDKLSRCSCCFSSCSMTAYSPIDTIRVRGEDLIMGSVLPGRERSKLEGRVICEHLCDLGLCPMMMFQRSHAVRRPRRTYVPKMSSDIHVVIRAHEPNQCHLKPKSKQNQNEEFHEYDQCMCIRLQINQYYLNNNQPTTLLILFSTLQTKFSASSSSSSSYALLLSIPYMSSVLFDTNQSIVVSRSWS